MRCSDDQWIIMFRLVQMEKIRGRIDPRVLDVPYRPTILLVINMDCRFFFGFFLVTWDPPCDVKMKSWLFILLNWGIEIQLPHTNHWTDCLHAINDLKEDVGKKSKSRISTNINIEILPQIHIRLWWKFYALELLSSRLVPLPWHTPLYWDRTWERSTDLEHQH